MFFDLNLWPVLPEIIMVIFACVALLVSLFVGPKSNLVYFIVQAAIILSLCVLLWVFSDVEHNQVAFSFNRMFVLDELAVLMKLFICALTFFTLLYARYYNDQREILRTEYYVLALLSTLGMMVMVSAHHLLIFYLGLELFSLPTYAMVAMLRNSDTAVEAGMKYFIISAVASCLLLYGFSFLFGITGEFEITRIAQVLPNQMLSQPYLSLLALVFIVSGLVFKLGVVPFHMWVPDVYSGAPTSTTLFIAAAPKLAALVMMLRILIIGLPQLVMHWQWILIVVSVLSMAIGNFSAIAQTNVKRLLAYSSIAHMGFMLLGVLVVNSVGLAACVFYVISYAIMTLAGFGVMMLMSRAGVDCDNLSDYSGLSRRHPFLAFVMLLVMFSMAGVPPLLGFIAKLHILEALVVSHLTWLAVVALLFSVVGAYYYLRVIQRMYFNDSEAEESGPVIYSLDLKCALFFNAALVIFLGLFPNMLFVLANDAIRFMV